MMLLLFAAAAAADDFSDRLESALRQAAADANGVEPGDVEVVSAGFGGSGCGDSIVIDARPGEDFIGPVELRATGLDGGVQCGSWRLRTRLAVWKTVPVAAKAAAAGELIAVDTRRVRLERSPGIPVSTSGGPYVARTGVRSGQVVVAELTKVPPDVDTGQLVQIIIQSGSVSLRSEGYLAESGNVGQPIRVRSAVTHTILNGTLVTEDQVVIR